MLTIPKGLKGLAPAELLPVARLLGETSLMFLVHPTNTAEQMASYAAADRIGHALPQPTPELLQGFDTVTQITALAHWLRHQPSPRIALGSQGIRVGPADWPTPSSAERRKLLRDALRLTLWRATGSTGAWLAPQIAARKRADCGV